MKKLMTIAKDVRVQALLVGSAAVLGTASPAMAASTPATTYNYYVSATGSDSNPGTSAAPFKTLKKAAAVATRASTTVWVAPGTYAGGIKTTASGTSSGRIYWVSTTKWGAHIVPPSGSTSDAAWDNRGSYVSIIGFDVDGTKYISGTKWLLGLYNGGSYDVIQGNHVHNIAQNVTCGSGGGSAIDIDAYYHGVSSDVIGNVVHDIGMTGCTYIQGIYVSTTGTVKDNLVYRIGEAGIHLWHDAHNVTITNNTVTNSGYGVIVGGGDTYFYTGGDDYTVVNSNIFYANKYGISEQGKTGTHNSYNNNLVYANTTSNISLRNGLTAKNTVASNPLFKAYATTGTPDFHLTSSSPAIGRGTSVGAMSTDLDGKPRNSTTGYDIGAYQH
jgi:parallel beta-helix repeat protein